MPISLTIIRPIIWQDLESNALNLLTFYLVYFLRRVGLRKYTTVKNPRLLGFELMTLLIQGVGCDHPIL